jgi:hypothetical protein
MWSSNWLDQTTGQVRNMQPAGFGGSPFTGQPSLIIEYFTPNALMGPLPRYISNKCYEIEVYKSQAGMSIPGANPTTAVTGNTVQPLIGDGDTFQLSTGLLTGPVVQMKGIPDTILIFAKKALSQGTDPAEQSKWVWPNYLSPQYQDVHAPIVGISVSFNNTSGMFSTYTPEMLYQLSVRNGSKLNYTQWFMNAYTGDSNGMTWQYHTGPDESVALLEQGNLLDQAGPGGCIVLRGSDLCSDGTFGTSSLGLFNFQVTANCVNTLNVGARNNAGMPFGQSLVLYYVFIRDGVLTYDSVSGTHQKMISVIGTAELTAPDVPVDHLPALEDKVSLYGGSFLDFLKDVGSNILKLGPGVARVVGNVLQHVPGVGPAFKVAGDVVSQGLDSVRSAVGAGRRRMSRKGGARLGHAHLM